MKAVETHELTKSYGDLTALDGLSLDVERGEVFGLLGPNGAGKSTCIEVLTGQTKPTSGTASVLGVDPVEDPVGVRREIGVLPEREDPPSFMTPREYFEFVGRVRDFDVDGAAERWGASLGFAGKLDTLNIDLSRGQKQKVMLAQAFVHEPELVFIDEPLTNLDPVVQERVKSLVADYNDDGGTVFLSTHDIHVAEELCTRVGIIQDGVLVATREVGDLDGDGRLIDEFLDAVEHEVDPRG
ncbi:MAG: ABC transporter ATP-binding protein [Halobacteriales archaeon]